MKATVGFLFKDFVSAADFEGPCKYAEEIGVLVWKNEARRMFFVTRHEQVAGFVKNRGKGEKEKEAGKAQKQNGQ